MVEEQRRFLVFADDADRGFICDDVFSRNPRTAATEALRSSLFAGVEEVFVFETKRAARFVRTFTAERG